MRIALFSDTYLPQVNGVANTLGRLVSEAHGRGHEVALITPRVSRSAAAWTGLHLQSPGISLPQYPELLIASPILSRLEGAMAAFSPDIVHVATEATVGFAGRRWALRRGVPLLTSFHTNYADYASGYGMGMLEGGIWRYLRWFHGAARISLHPSSATLEMLVAQGFHSRWRLWSRGVNAEAFSPVHRREGVREELAPDAETIILYVGRIAPEKRCRLAIEAFDRVREEFPGAVFVLVGDGPARKALEAMRVPGVRFAGYLRGKALAMAYAAADLLLFPSDTETFGNVVTEAFASGIPAIVADRGGVRDTVIPGETGIRCTPGDTEAFAEALRTLLRDPDLRRRLGAGARKAALSRSWETVFDGLFDAYAEVTGRTLAREASWTS